jgi:lipopolysaccharide transport system permease protein
MTTQDFSPQSVPLNPDLNAAPEAPTDVIEPRRAQPLVDLRNLWKYRVLLYFLTWRDIKLRYKQTVLGAGWAVFQPVITMLIFTVIFGNFAKLSSDGLPYAIFAYTGLLPWTYFSQALTRASNVLVFNSNLINKVYFPRLILMLSAVTVPVIDFCLSFLILLGMMAYFEVPLTWSFLAAPVFLLLGMFVAFTIGLWLAAVNVKYRDVGIAIPFFIQIWLYASPVAYPTSTVPEQWQFLYGLNPMTTVIEGFRWALLHKATLNVDAMALSIVVTLVLLWGGLRYFRRRERKFADII